MLTNEPAPTHHDALDEVLRRIEIEKFKVRQELDGIKSSVDIETRKVIESLDRVFQSQIQKDIGKHHQEVSNILRQVRLSDDVSDVILAQLKAPLGRKDLTKYIDEVVQ